MPDIVEIAAGDDRFEALVTAVKAAGLVDTLKGKGPYTVFAPTDEAFGKLPEGTLDDLLENTDQLKNVLLYHVVPGKHMANEVTGMSSAETALGQDVQIRTSGGKVMVEDAEVIITDIEASNGVIHVIDSVLIPS